MCQRCFSLAFLREQYVKVLGEGKLGWVDMFVCMLCEM